MNTLPVNLRVDVALKLLGDIGTPDPKNYYAGLRDSMAGAKGRVVSFWTGFQDVEIHGMLSRCSRADRYVLEFTITVREGATTLGIMRAATRVAELQAQAPKFEKHELQEVYAALEEALGPIQRIE